MRKIITICMMLAIVAGVYAQIDITKRTVTTDSLRSRQDTLWITNKSGGVGWIRVSSGDSLFFGDSGGEISLGRIKQSASNYYSGQGVTVAEGRINLGDSTTSSINQIYIDPTYTSNSYFGAGSNTSFKYIYATAQDRVQISTKDTTTSLLPTYIQIHKDEISMASSSRDSIVIKLSDSNGVAGKIIGKADELYFQNRSGARRSFTQLACLNGLDLATQDTTVTAVVGRIVFKISDTHFYGCRKLTGQKWFQLDQ